MTRPEVEKKPSYERKAAPRSHRWTASARRGIQSGRAWKCSIEPHEERAWEALARNTSWKQYCEAERSKCASAVLTDRLDFRPRIKQEDTVRYRYGGVHHRFDVSPQLLSERQTRTADEIERALIAFPRTEATQSMETSQVKISSWRDNQPQCKSRRRLTWRRKPKHGERREPEIAIIARVWIRSMEAMRNTQNSKIWKREMEIITSLGGTGIRSIEPSRTSTSEPTSE